MMFKRTVLLFLCAALPAAANEGDLDSLREAAQESFFRRDYESAEKYWKRALEACEGLTHDDPRLSETLHQYGCFEFKTGHIDEAEELYERALKIRRAMKSPTDTANTLSLLGNLYLKKKHYQEAQAVFAESLRLRQESLPPSDPDIAISLNNLGDCYRLQEKYQESEPMLKKALQIDVKKYGKDHFAIVYPYASIADLRADMGDYKSAERFYKKALKVNRKWWGENNEDTATILEDLAYLYAKMDRKRDEITSLLKQVVAIRKEVLGPNHPATVSSINNLNSMTP